MPVYNKECYWFIFRNLHECLKNSVAELQVLTGWVAVLGPTICYKKKFLFITPILDSVSLDSENSFHATGSALKVFHSSSCGGSRVADLTEIQPEIYATCCMEEEGF